MELTGTKIGSVMYQKDTGHVPMCPLPTGGKYEEKKLLDEETEEGV